MTATHFLFAAKRRKNKAKNRLREIIVDKVAVVDRAANQRKFLVIKREGDGDMPPNPKDPDMSVILTAAAKSDFVDSLTPALGSLIAVSEAVKAADENDEEGKAQLPADLIATLKQVNDGVVEVYLEQLAKDSGDIVESLVKVAKLSIALAEDVATGGEVTDEVKARANQMAEVLKGIVAGEAPAPANSDKTITPPVADPPVGDPPKADPPVGDPPKVVDADKSKDAPVDDPRITALTGVVETLAGKVDTLTEEISKSRDDKQDKTNTEIKDKLTKMDESIAATRKRVDKAMGEPPKRGSFDVRSAETGIVKNNSGQRIFPETYGDPVHDPEPAAPAQS